LTAYCSPFAEFLLCRYPNIDGVVAVTHTEGGGETTPNNRDLLLRTLAGFFVHPNVGAVLAVDLGTEPVNNSHLISWLKEHEKVFFFSVSNFDLFPLNILLCLFF
jgi:altronate dehydratase